MSDERASQGRCDVDRALREAAAGVAGYAQLLVRAALAAGGRDLVAKTEAALQAGGVTVVRCGLLTAGGAELVVTIEGQPGPAVELFSATGT